MVEETLSLEEIPEREKHVLFDASIISHEVYDWYSRYVYDARSFSGIDAGVLRLEAKRLEESLSILTHPNVYTVPGTISEFKKARAIVQETRNFLNAGYEYNQRRHRHPRESHPRGEAQRNLLTDIHDLFHKLYIWSRNSLLKPGKKNLCGILENIVLSVTEETDSKIDFSPRYRDFSKPKVFNTDEQLVAMALYLSLTGEKNCIITGDSDIRRILFNSLRYLFDSEARWRVGDLEEAIEKNRIVIYNAASPGQTEICLNTSGFRIKRALSFATVSTINQSLMSQLPTTA